MNVLVFLLNSPAFLVATRKQVSNDYTVDKKSDFFRLNFFSIFFFAVKNDGSLCGEIISLYREH